jgi:hypothetical protein
MQRMLAENAIIASVVIPGLRLPKAIVGAVEKEQAWAKATPTVNRIMKTISVIIFKGLHPVL